MPGRDNLRTKFVYLIKQINYYFLLSPLFVSVFLSFLIVNDIYSPKKSTLEYLALIILGCSTLICAFKYLLLKHSFLLWCTALTVVLFIREIHFEGTCAGVYIALLVMLWLALVKFEHYQDYLANSCFVTALAVGFSFYLISVSIDQRWWRGFPSENIVHVPLEETLEVIGHILIGSTLVLAKPRRG